MSRALLTADQVVNWQRRVEEIDKEELRLQFERQDLKRKLEAAKVLFGDLSDLNLDEDPGSAPVSEPELEPPVVTVRVREGKPTWPAEIERIFNEVKRPLTFEQLKVEIDKGPLKGEYAKSEKGFYHAVSRLQKKGYLSKHRGWLFRTTDLWVHRKEVEAGRKDEIPEAVGAKRSPMGEEVKAYLIRHPHGVKSGDVVEYLKSDSRFSETLNKNATGGYNVISRLAKRGEIRKEGTLLYPLHENGATTGNQRYTPA